MSEVVLGASALPPGMVQHEPGQERVEAILHEATICSVNLAEVVTKMRDAGRGEPDIAVTLGAFPLIIVPLSEPDAYQTDFLRLGSARWGCLSETECASL